MHILKIIAVMINLAFGMYSFFQPEPIARASGLEPSARGRAEIRVAFGGYFIAFGLAALLLNDITAYRMLGAGWIGGAAARVLSLAYEDRAIVDQSFIGLLIVEVVVGLVLVI